MSFPNDATLSHILVVSDLSVSVIWYRDVLGAELYREYGGTTAVYSLNGAWIILVTAGGPTQDKPGIRMAPPHDGNLVAHSMTLRVQNCRADYDELVERGAQFLTPPVESEWEIRAFFRDPDQHLFEISEAKN